MGAYRIDRLCWLSSVIIRPLTLLWNHWASCYRISRRWGEQKYSNGPCHMTNMATTPIYGKNLQNIFFSRTNCSMALKLGIEGFLVRHNVTQSSGLGCSKLTPLLVNVLLKFQTWISEVPKFFLLKKCQNLSFFSTKKSVHFGYKVIEHFNNELTS